MLGVFLLFYIYALSAILIYTFLYIAYSDKGVWWREGWYTIDTIDRVFIFMPGLNIILAFMLLFEPPFRNKKTIFLHILFKNKHDA